MHSIINNCLKVLLSLFVYKEGTAAVSELANKNMCLHKLHMQVSVASCQLKFVVHEVMESVANLKIHLTVKSLTQSI